MVRNIILQFLGELEQRGGMCTSDSVEIHCFPAIHSQLWRSIAKSELHVPHSGLPLHWDEGGSLPRCCRMLPYAATSGHRQTQQTGKKRGKKEEEDGWGRRSLSRWLGHDRERGEEEGVHCSEIWCTSQTQ